MDSIIIEGGCKLKGKVRISGSKNAALPELFATLLSDDKIILKNVPSGLNDIKTAVSLLEITGKKVKISKSDPSCFEITSAPSSSFLEIPYELVRQMRASVLLAGPILARYGRVKISLPGGCAIGVRPIDIHLDGFKAMGASIKLSEGYVDLKSHGRLKGGIINLKFPSVGATENLLMAATLAEGKTIIRNVAREPEIGDLCRLLISLGADISGIDTSVLVIQGTPRLLSSAKKVEHYVIPDRIETATYIAAAVITGSDITLTNASQFEHIKSFVKKLSIAGAKLMYKGNGTITIHSSHLKKIKPVSVRTAVYPGFPTDLQAQWMALMTQATGKCKITETIFENRYLHVAELKRLGAELEIKGNTVYVKGPSHLEGAPVMVSDLRAGAALVLAGLVAYGKTLIQRVYHLDRGYENLVGKLSDLGANIRRIKN